MSKVKFGLKNAHYALATINSDGTATYGEPKKLPGAVSINLDPAGEATNFYADDQVYYTIDGASGYTGTLELALIPDDFRKDCLGETADAAGVLVESAEGDFPEGRDEPPGGRRRGRLRDNPLRPERARVRRAVLCRYYRHGPPEDRRQGRRR